MPEREVKFKLGWFNIFNMGGALYGWMHGHTWEDAAVGFLVGSVAPVAVIFGALAIALVVVKGSEMVVDAMPTRARIAETFRVETDEQRWEREYAEHCSKNHIVNELRSPIHRKQHNMLADNDFSTSSTSDFDYHYTSGGGPG